MERANRVGFRLMQLASECRRDPRGVYLRAVKGRRARVPEHNRYLPEIDEMIRKEESNEGEPVSIETLRKVAGLLLWMMIAEATEQLWGPEARAREEHLMLDVLIDTLEQPAPINPRPPRHVA